MRRLVFGGVFAFTVVSLFLIQTLSGRGVAHASDFCVTKDAFSISNAPGWCFAMAAFSRWYYLNFPAEARLRQVLDPKAQQLIAKELQEYYSKNLIRIQAEYCNKYHGNQTESFRRFIAGIMGGEPRLVLLMNKGARGVVLHAVLAYGWIPEQNVLKVYDPNYSIDERFIDLEKCEYTSLDITYHAICFPEVLHDHKALVRKMEDLFTQYGRTRTASQPKGPVKFPNWQKAETNERTQVSY